MKDLLGKALEAQKAAESRYNNLSPDVDLDIEAAVYYECEAARNRVNGLIREERRGTPVYGSRREQKILRLNRQEDTRRTRNG